MKIMNNKICNVFKKIMNLKNGIVKIVNHNKKKMIMMKMYKLYVNVKSLIQLQL